MPNCTVRVTLMWNLALVFIATQLCGLLSTDAFISPAKKWSNVIKPGHHICSSQPLSSRICSANTYAPFMRSKKISTRSTLQRDDEDTIGTKSRKMDSKHSDEMTSFIQVVSKNIKIAPVIVATFLAITASTASIQPANAVLGAGGAAVTSPSVVKGITLEDFLKLSAKKQRQYEGGFLSCTYDKVGLETSDITEVITRRKVAPKLKKICKPTNVIDELLKEIDALAGKDPERAEEYKALASNILQRQRFVDRQNIEAALGKQPTAIYFTCAFLAACVATSIMHPIDTLKVRLMSGKGDDDEGEDGSLEDEEGTSIFSVIGDLYDGLLPNLLKEGPASALYLGIYEYSRMILEGVPFLQGNVLLIYLLAGSIGELAGSVVRSPAEAVKTRVQAGLYSASGAVENVFFTDEGRRNTFSAWSAGVFRDVPHGAILIATFELTKTLIVESSFDVDVNTLLAEAALGGFGGGLGAFVSTPSDVVTTKIITSIEDGGEAPSPLDTLAEVWNEGGLNGLFSGVKERVGYWTLSYGIFLSVYCSLRQYALVHFS